MADLGINTVRTYTPPRADLLDEAARHGLRVMVGLPWSQHVAFLDNHALKRSIRRDIAAQVRAIGSHPAVAILALGNEIPPGVVRWHGRVSIERYLRELYEDAKAASPDSLFTYVNFPPTEFLDLSFFDLYSFNVYLHRERELRAYLARLQHVAGQKPLLLAEAGADSIREGETGQAEITAMHIRTAFEEGACGAIAFAWTDEWWRGGYDVEDWAFGLVDRQRTLKPAAAAVAAAFDAAPFSREAVASWPRVSVVVCAYNAADTIDGCLSSLENLTYPDYEIILVNDGSRDAHRRDRPPPPAGAGDRDSERRAERGAQRRAGRGERRDRRLHGRRRAGRSRLADVSRPAVPHVGCRGIGRPERGAARRPADGAMHRARARQSDARAARRSHRRTRAGLQHGVPPRRAARGRRLQRHLPARRRRRGHVLAAAGARLEDRLRVGGAGVAPPPVDREGLLAAAGRLRRRRNVADGAPPGEVPRRPHAVARADLQPAAVRAIALGHAHQRRRLGHGGVSVGLPHRRPSVRVSAALDQVAGGLLRVHARRPGRGGDGAALVVGGAAARRRPDRHRGHDREERHLRARGPTSTRCRAGGSGIARSSPISISFSRSPASAAGSAARCRRRKSRCPRSGRRRAAGRGRRSPKRGARCC